MATVGRFKALLAATAAVFLLSITAVFAQDSKVTRIQRALVVSGYDPGPVDGYWGNRTSSALAQMAGDMGLASAPKSKAGITSEVITALDNAYQTHLEQQERGRRHLQEVMTVADARHLLERSGVGAHPSEILKLLGLNRSAAVTSIMEGLDGSDTSIAPPAFLTAPRIPEYWIRWDYEEDGRQRFRVARDKEMGELRNWWIKEMIATPSPQAERLILLWHNHFVTAYSGVQEEVHAVARQHWTFRELGHTNFRDLTRALVRDAAMLNYLDNDRSRKEQPNENFARELMELFVLGEGNYSEETVKEVARALTGYSYNKMRNFEFEFKPWHHDKGIKNVFDKRGRFDGDEIVDILLAQPAAAEFIVDRFWNVYVSDFNKDPEEIKRIADVFRSSDFDIKVLLRAILASKAFWADDNRATIVKSPIDLLVGSIRSTGVLPAWWASLPNRLASIGQNLFEAPNVAGWPGGADWVTASRLLIRREMVMDIASAEPSREEKDNNMMLSEVAAPVVAMSNIQMMSAPQPKVRKVSVRYAAEDFEGSPKFNITTMGQKDGMPWMQWRSELFEAEGGIDTARFGRVENNDLPWRIATFEMPAGVTYNKLILEFVNDHCCGLGGSDGGDRNLFVDWVALEGRLYLASDGKQTNNYGNCGTARPGKMYCSSKLVLTEFQSFKSGERAITEASGDTLDATLVAERVAFKWAEKLDPNDHWNSFTFALLNPSAAGISIDGIQVRIVRNRYDNGWRTLLQLEDRSCFPSCLGGPLPRSAYTNKNNGDRNVSFILLGPEWRDEKSQWNQLTDAQRKFVSALWMSVPEMLAEAVKGRNWRERDAKNMLKSWLPIFDEIEKSLPKSRYAKLAAKGGLRVIEREEGEAVMSMMAALSNTSPQQIAGIDRQEASWPSWQDRLQPQSLSQTFLAAAPITFASTTQNLMELMLDPVFNLK